jgi:hypothetical protein
MRRYLSIAALLALGLATGAEATTLSFDDLVGTYGDQFPLGPNMTSDRSYLAYTESGYVLTLITTIPPGATVEGAHIGDGTRVDRTYNWHDGGGNRDGAYVTLTKMGGGTFDLIDFDYDAERALLVTAPGYSAFNLLGAGTYLANFIGVTSVTFSGGTNSGLDNIRFADPSGGVPEPASWAMLLTGFAAVGVMARRRRVLAPRAG